MTDKDDCGRHSDRKKLLRRLFAAFVSLTILVLFIILLFWLILRPQKPHFLLQDATIYAFNLSATNFLTSNIQITLSSRNPNDKIGIYYDKLDVSAFYHSQQITVRTMLPATYQGHKDIITWSPFVLGNSVPVAPHLAGFLSQEQLAGTVVVSIRVDGRIRWKVGTFVSGKYSLHVNCPAYISPGNKNSGIVVGPGTKYQLVMDCHVGL